MTTLEILNANNLLPDIRPCSADLIYADYVYENTDFTWVTKYWEVLKPGGVFIAQTDHHSLFQLGMFFTGIKDAELLNHLVWKNEWGGHPRDRFHQSFDDILIYVKKGKKHKFYSNRIQVPKVTANTRLNPSGRQYKTATAFISDICLTTTSRERVRGSDGHLIRWQKPSALLERLFLPFLDPGDLVIDPFMGSGTSLRVCNKLGYNYLGIEIDPDVFKLAKDSINVSN